MVDGLRLTAVASFDVGSSVGSGCALFFSLGGDAAFMLESRTDFDSVE